MHTQKQPVSSMDPACASKVTEVPTLEPAKEAREQKDHQMQQLTLGEATCLTEEVSYNLLCSHLHLVGRTTTSVRPQEALWQCSLQNLHPSTSRLTYTTKNDKLYCLQDFHLLILLSSPLTFVACLLDRASLFRVVGLAFFFCSVYIDHRREALPLRAAELSS